MADHPIFKSAQPLLNVDSKVIQLTFGSRKVKAGERIPKRGEYGNSNPWLNPGNPIPKQEVSLADPLSLAEAQETPTLVLPTASGRTQKYIVVCIDIDPPFPSWSALGPALHWLQDGLAVDAASGGSLASSDPVIAFWAAPGPPPISSPHRYMFFLYEQPADFDRKRFTKASGYGIRDRMRWDLSKFEKQTNLGAPVAATYFLSK
jgi:phosphatidylethanolamine-binding protein (PEBP) family uncharacterized protein